MLSFIGAARDQGPYNRSYYQRNREHEIARVRLRQDVTRDLLRGLRDRPCADCGGSYRAHQMDFDHRDPGTKSFRISSGRAMLAPIERLFAEVDKCDVVCANCHRIRIWRQGSVTRRLVAPASRNLERKRSSWRAHARLLDSIKDAPCVDCGRRFPPSAMDFDHRDAGTKRVAVSRMIGRAGTAAIMAEVAKCDIVCANCHRERTFCRREASSGRE